jgi:mannose-6-phosphate isomerase-like protein (cupin superfamily)
MYRSYRDYLCPYWIDVPIYNPYNMFYVYNKYPDPYREDTRIYGSQSQLIRLKDYGPNPYVVDIERATTQNDTYRTALWTGDNLQVTLMSIDVGDDIGLEVHPDGDQFIRIEEGEGLVRMGDSRDNLNFQKRVFDDFAIMIPAGKWHNVINTGDMPLKLYAIYAPPEHSFGTVHRTKQDAEEDEG